MSKENQIEETIEFLNNRINVERNSYFGKGCITIPLIEVEKILDILKGYRKQSEGEWISVEERLPEPHKLVLVLWERVGEGTFYGFARYQREDVWYVSNEGMPRVTHWMPLPEPPEMKGGAEE